MRFMVMVKATKDSEAGVMPSREELAEMGRYNEELVKAGVMQAGEGLHPSSKGARVRFSGKDRRVIDGPSPRPRSWSPASGSGSARRCRRRSSGSSAARTRCARDSEIEIRQIFEAEDFGEAFTPELREQEERLRKEAQSRDGLIEWRVGAGN